MRLRRLLCGIFLLLLGWVAPLLGAEDLPKTMIPLPSSTGGIPAFTSLWQGQLVWSEMTDRSVGGFVGGRVRLNRTFLDLEEEAAGFGWEEIPGEVETASAPLSRNLYTGGYEPGLFLDLRDAGDRETFLGFFRAYGVLPFWNDKYYRDDLEGVPSNRGYGYDWYARWYPNVATGEPTGEPGYIDWTLFHWGNDLLRWILENIKGNRDLPFDGWEDDQAWMTGLTDSWYAFISESDKDGTGSFMADVGFASPLFVPRHNPLMATMEGYRAFTSSGADRVYTPSNEGFIHAFSIVPFRETWAFSPPPAALWSYYYDYIRRINPDGHLPRLPLLGGPFVVGDVESSPGNWKRILFGTTGQGTLLRQRDRPNSFADSEIGEGFQDVSEASGAGNSTSGIYALDVTDPDRPVHLWSVMNDQWYPENRLQKRGRLSLFRVTEGPATYKYKRVYSENVSSTVFRDLEVEGGAAPHVTWQSETYDLAADELAFSPYTWLASLASQPALGFTEKDGNRAWHLLFSGGSVPKDGAQETFITDVITWLGSLFDPSYPKKVRDFLFDQSTGLFDVDPLSGGIRSHYRLSEEVTFRNEQTLLDRFVAVRPFGEVRPKIDSILVHLANGALYDWPLASGDAPEPERIFSFEEDEKGNVTTIWDNVFFRVSRETLHQELFPSYQNPDVAYFRSTEGTYDRFVAFVVKMQQSETARFVPSVFGTAFPIRIRTTRDLDDPPFLLFVINVDAIKRAIAENGDGYYRVSPGPRKNWQNSVRSGPLAVKLYKDSDKNTKEIKSGLDFGWGHYLPLAREKKQGSLTWEEPVSAPFFYNGKLVFATRAVDEESSYLYVLDISPESGLTGALKGVKSNYDLDDEVIDKGGLAVAYGYDDDHNAPFSGGMAIRDGIVYVPAGEDGMQKLDIREVLGSLGGDSGSGTEGLKTRYWRIVE